MWQVVLTMISTFGFTIFAKKLKSALFQKGNAFTVLRRGDSMYHGLVLIYIYLVLM